MKILAMLLEAFMYRQMILISAILIAPVMADTTREVEPQPQSWRGGGRDFGRGYQSRGGGRRLEGTGRDFGHGWRKGGDAAWHGSGENFGRRRVYSPEGTKNDE